MNIIITGASKGFGKSLARKFAANGHNVYICSRSAAQLYKTLEELVTEFSDVTIKAMPCDISDKQSVNEFADWIAAQKIDVDVLINNAGYFIPGSVYNEEEGVLEEMLSVNLLGAYNLTRKLLPAMMARKSGHIFNMCSIASLKAYANGGAYSISKFAMLGFSKNLREEMKPHNIKVTAVMPGAAYTDSWSGSGVDPKRIMESEDIANMVFAASQLSPTAVVEDIILRPQLGDL
jgi:short-subunit dehydrogenase